MCEGTGRRKNQWLDLFFDRERRCRETRRRETWRLFPLLLVVAMNAACSERERDHEPYPRNPTQALRTTATHPRIVIDTTFVIGDSLEVAGSVRGLPGAVGWSGSGDSSTIIVDYRLLNAQGDTLRRGLLRAGGAARTMCPLQGRLPLPIDFNDTGRIEFYLAAIGDFAMASSPVDATKIRRGLMTTMHVYFSNIHMGRRGECASVFPVARFIRRSANYIDAAIGLLLKGPTDDEFDKGYRTALPGGLRLRERTYNGGIARLTFNSEIDRPMDSCRARTLREQIRSTLLQFASVRDVVW